MPFSTSPRAKGSKGRKKDSVAWASDTSSAAEQQQLQGEEMAPFSSNGITAESAYSSNNSGAAERMRTLDMDPEAVSHVSWAGGGGRGRNVQKAYCKGLPFDVSEKCRPTTRLRREMWEQQQQQHLRAQRKPACMTIVYRKRHNSRMEEQRSYSSHVENLYDMFVSCFPRGRLSICHPSRGTAVYLPLCVACVWRNRKKIEAVWWYTRSRGTSCSVWWVLRHVPLGTLFRSGSCTVCCRDQIHAWCLFATALDAEV